MIRDDRFLISRRPYAVDMTSLTGTLDTSCAAPVYRGYVNAVWFRRHKGRINACVGQLWDFQPSEPTDAEQFLARLTDGRSGGRCHGRWNGTSYWSEDGRSEEKDAHLAVLRPMLTHYASPPDGYDGWWRF